MRPDAVRVAALPDGRQHVRLARDIVERIETQEEGDEGAVYSYEEVAFTLEKPVETGEIEKHFAQWWAYGLGEGEPLPSVEERLEALEDIVLEMLLGGAEQ